MRALRPAAALAAFALLSSLPLPAGAHNGQGFPHVNPLPMTLGPNETKPVELVFAEGSGTVGAFEAGSVFVLSVVAPSNGTLDVALRHGHDVAPGDLVANWTACCAQDTDVFTARFPTNDTYTLWLHNPQGVNASTIFFYDQSCNCAGKPIPAEVVHGMVVFNADTFRAGWLHAQIFEPAALRAKIRMGTLPPDGTYPQDFREVARSDAGAPVPGATTRVHDFNVSVDAGTRYYFFTQGVSVDPKLVDPQDLAGSLMVTPLYDQGVVKAPAKAPLPPLLAPLAMAGAALALARRRGKA